MVTPTFKPNYIIIIKLLDFDYNVNIIEEKNHLDYISSKRRHKYAHI